MLLSRGRGVGAVVQRGEGGRCCCPGGRGIGAVVQGG